MWQDVGICQKLDNTLLMKIRHVEQFRITNRYQHYKVILLR